MQSGGDWVVVEETRKLNLTQKEEVSAWGRVQWRA